MNINPYAQLTSLPYPLPFDKLRFNIVMQHDVTLHDITSYRNRYVVCVVDITSLNDKDSHVMAVIGQVASPSGARAPYPLVKNLWARGGEGLGLFHSSDAKLSLCITKENYAVDQSTIKEIR